MNFLSSVIGFALALPLAFQMASAESFLLCSITGTAFTAALGVNIEIDAIVRMPARTMDFQPVFNGHATVATFSNHVAIVVAVGAEEKMIRVATPGMITPMADANVLRNWPDGKLVGHPVAGDGFTIDTKLPVSLPMCACCPGPAPSRNNPHLGPEPFHEFQRTSLFNSSQLAEG